MAQAPGIYHMGNEFYSTYSPTAQGAVNLIDDFYANDVRAYSEASFGKSAGAATYGAAEGMFNPVFGRRITAGMFASDNVFTAIGARAYDHEGVRIADAMADYGTDANSNFLGIGATTVRDGAIGESNYFDPQEVREPYKEVPFAWDFGLGLLALESKQDDVGSYDDYVNIISANYSDQIDKALLRPINVPQPTYAGQETSLNSIHRVASSYTEGQTLGAEIVSPYGGREQTGVPYAKRSVGPSNFDGQYVSAEGGALSFELMDSLWSKCAINWDGGANPNGKAWFISNTAQIALSALARAQNIRLESVYTENSFNGVKTFPGRDYGNLYNSYMNVPLITDGNVNYDYGNLRVAGSEEFNNGSGTSAAYMGDIDLVDTRHMFMRIITPVQMYTAENPAYTRTLLQKNVFLSRMELGCDRFINHGRVTNIGAVLAAPDTAPWTLGA